MLEATPLTADFVEATPDFVQFIQGWVDSCYFVRYTVRFIVMKGIDMTTLNATDARARLYHLIDETTETHRPIVITGKRGNAVLISEADWNSINETLHLLSVPGMRESIREGMETDLKDCDKDLDW